MHAIRGMSFTVAILSVLSASAAEKELRAVAQANAVAVRTVGQGQPGFDRWIVDPQDNVERFLLLTPNGPLVIELRLTIDGEPFRAGRERLIDEMLKQADKDGDNVPTWKEGFANPRFGFGRFAYLGMQNEEQREQIIKSFDRNQNGRLDRGEARAFMAQNFGGATFGLQAFNFQPASQETTRRLLDINGDGAISGEELGMATERLRSRDGDDNELLYAAEISGQTNGYGYQIVNGRVGGGAQAMALLLGPLLDSASVYSTLLERYKGADGQLTATDFALTPSLIPTLDVNGNGQLDQYELTGLNAIAPHIRVSGKFADGDGGTVLELNSVSTELGSREGMVSSDSDSTRLVLAGLQLRLLTPPPAPMFNYQAQADATMARLDTNKNGYIEKEEVSGANQPFAVQFDSWDEDGDGKVFPAEIKSFYDRQFAPLRTQISAMVSEEQDPFFAVLDANGDGRLSVREMRAAGARLRTFDADNDGQITAADVPARISISFNRGQAQYGRQPGVTIAPSSSGGVVGRPGQQPGSGGLEWFTKMDRNGDGDLSPREFLGTNEQFSRLDTDQDGLIDRAEAEKAK